MNLCTASYREQQRRCGFDVEKLAGLHRVMRAKPTQERTVTILEDDGTVSQVPLAEAERRAQEIIDMLKAERPCLPGRCGNHPCPPGTSYNCAISTDMWRPTRTGPGTGGYELQLALDAYVAEHGDPYNEYDEEGAPLN